MNNQKLTELVKKAQAGDKKALNDLVAQCYGDIYYYILKTVKSNDIAEDVTQESFVEITTTLNSLREPAAFNVWARRIAYHKCAVHFRGTKEVLLDEDEDGETLFDRLPDESDSSLPEKVMEDKEFCKTVLDMINSLPSEQANALLLYYYEKMSIKQIATIQDTTEGTVKSRLNYARKAVKGKVEEYEKKTGTRLHSVAILPLLLRFVYKSEKASMPAVSVPTAVTAITATTAAKVGTGALVTKITAGVLAATVAIGGIGFGVSKLIKNRNQRDATENNDMVVVGNGQGVNSSNNSFLDEKPEEAIFPLIGTWRQIQPDKEEPVHSFVIDEDRNLIKDGVVYPLSDIYSDEEGEYTLYYGEDSYDFELENGKYYYRDYQENITEYSFSYSYDYKDYMYLKDEDYVEYDIIELTPENILDYIEITPIFHTDVDENGKITRFYCYGTQSFFKKGLGEPSFVDYTYKYKSEKTITTFNTKTGEVTYGEVLESEDKGGWNTFDSIQGGGKGEEETLISFNGENWWNEKKGLDEIKGWPGTAETIDLELYLTKGASFNEVYGVVYVPKGWQG